MTGRAPSLALAFVSPDSTVDHTLWAARRRAKLARLGNPEGPTGLGQGPEFTSGAASPAVAAAIASWAAASRTM